MVKSIGGFGELRTEGLLSKECFTIEQLLVHANDTVHTRSC